MPGVTLPGATSSAAQPLTSDESQRALRLAQRLHADLARLIDALPERARAASAMARHLGIVRNTCQRTLNALQDDTPSLETLAKLPGVKGLEQMLDAIEERGGDAESLGLARTAVRAFDDLIRSLAGSHTKLTARLNALAETPGDDALGQERARQRLVEAAIGITGRAQDCTLGVTFFWPSDITDAGEPKHLNRIHISGVIGSTITPGGMPIVLSSGDTLDWCREEDRADGFLNGVDERGETPQAILAPFSSDPLPTVSTRGKANSLVQVIDPAHLDAPERFDLVTARRSRHPFYEPDSGNSTLHEVWQLISVPVAHLIFDVYLHRDMERLYRPSLESLMWNPGLTSPAGDHWILRYPSQPRLELLGPGLSRIATPGYPRLDELVRFTMGGAQLNPDDFVGFRCELNYPIFRGGYLMSFEHTGAKP